MQTAPLDAVMRTLADPTRRAIFERIVHAHEISVVELTAGSGVTQSAISQHLGSLKRAGLVVDPRAGPQRLLPCRPQRPGAACRLDGPLRRVLAQALC